VRVGGNEARDHQNTKMNANYENAIRYMVSLNQGATAAQCRQYLDLQIKVMGEEAGIAKIYRQGRYGKLIAPVSAALGTRQSASRWDDNDEGFVVTRKGIDVVLWLNEKIASGMTDEQIIEAAKNA
jgi:hypothetical protein